MKNTIRFLGITDERTSCDCCGKANLKRTVAIELDGEVLYFGTSCAAVRLNMAAKDVTKAAKKAQDERKAAERKAEAIARRAELEKWERFVLARSGAKDLCVGIEALGGYEAASALYEAQA